MDPFGRRGRSVKVAILVVGLVLLLVGILGALYGWFTASSAETAYNFICTGGQPEPFPGWCAALQSAASTYRTIAYAMAAVFVVGLALTVACEAMKERANQRACDGDARATGAAERVARLQGLLPVDVFRGPVLPELRNRAVLNYGRLMRAYGGGRAAGVATGLSLGTDSSLRRTFRTMNVGVSVRRAI